MEQQGFDLGPQRLVAAALGGNVGLALGPLGDLEGVEKDRFGCVLMGHHRHASSRPAGLPISSAKKLRQPRQESANFFGYLPIRYGSPASRESSWCSQARAKVQFRSALRSGMPSVAAASGIVRPAK